MTKIVPTVRKMEASDIQEAAKVHECAFPRQRFNEKWMSCAFASFPKSQCFVAEVEGKIVGLLIYTEKSGFRKEAIIDVEQGCVLPEYQGRGIGTALLTESLPIVAAEIAQRGDVMKTLCANTRADNALSLALSKKFGAEILTSMPGIFPVDEVYVVARDIDRFIQAKK